ncbi:unnamed protein product [Phytophthora lilii]|uniref:Unnamed protein product n=1 Tax=Phytophthora lilii TaxID=2077276 RepID=A0A9W6TIP7_9STRA|nr:unnamed protein product [Phytophthora lilii]
MPVEHNTTRKRSGEGETSNLAVLCLINELYIAQVRWNIEPTHYHEIEALPLHCSTIQHPWQLTSKTGQSIVMTNRTNILLEP